MLKIRVSAPPENGKANSAVEALLAEKLILPKSSIAVSTGKRAHNKIIEIQGLSYSEVLKRLGAKNA